MTTSKPSSNPRPVTAGDLLTAFDAMAEAARMELAERVASIGLPDAILPQIQATVALTLAGVRVALVRWSPRPAALDARDHDTLATRLEELVEARVAEALAEVTDKLGRSTQRATAALTAWNTDRPINGEVSPLLVQRAGEGPPQPDYDTFERVDLGGGKFFTRYRVKPDHEE